LSATTATLFAAAVAFGSNSTGHFYLEMRIF